MGLWARLALGQERRAHRAVLSPLIKGLAEQGEGGEKGQAKVGEGDGGRGEVGWDASNGCGLCQARIETRKLNQS